MAIQAKQAEQAKQVRHQQREEWSAAAPGWQTRRDEVSQPTRSITERLITMADITSGQRVLDLACGNGDPSFTLAQRVGPRGYVVGLDITEPMVRNAQAWAKEHGLTNVEYRVVSNELELGVPDASFDAATCRHGLMYMPEPVAALRTLYLALKPGGRVAISTWGPAERCPFFSLAMQIVMRHIELPPPDPGAPGPFALPTPERLTAILEAAGFTNVEVVAFETSVLEAESPAAYWDLLCEVAGPLVPLMASLPTEVRQALRDDAIKTYGVLSEDGPVKLGGEYLVAAGIKGHAH
ncbi:MAG: methyltransferase domain-containing protein [Chloroflexi bacterium]|nr:MAG: methyltransferase domain-containing protein [Chloroflexota bacterium]